MEGVKRMGRLARAKYVGARTWFALALVLGGCFLVGTIVYAIGVWNLATLRVEQWLLWRPETRVDCVLDEWRNLGAVPSSIILTCLLGIACVLCGYRRRVLPLLLLLLLLESGVEVVGKQLIALPLPATLRSGMTDLECPQMQDRP
ncbi:MAG TPA: hypothetical protein VHZ51_30485, partial [Ktedonobacteraceae bacterium]|nr:hypothetical protein [Ktedonobacteraceae bacterium]